MADREQMETIADELVEGQITVDQEVADVMDELLPNTELEKIELDVLGEKVEFTHDDVMDAGRRSLQKEGAIERKLELVSAREHELTEREELLVGRETEMREMEAGLIVSEPNQMGKDFAAAVFDNEDDLAKIFTTMDQRITKVSAENAELSKKIESDRLVEARKPVSYYHNKYDDIANDPNKHAVFNAQRKIIMDETPYMTEIESIDKAAKATEDVFSAVVNPKDNLVKQPSTVSTRKPKKPEEKDESFDDTLAEMRSGRAQAY